MPLNDQLEALSRPIVEAMGGFLVEAVLRGDGAGKVVEIFADTDAGITADECAGLSRTIAERLDAAGIVKGRYHLVVSSPGVGRPLKYFRQYPRNVGRRVEVLFRENGAEARCNGTLVEAEGGTIGVRTGEGEGEVRRIPAGDIIAARVLPAW